jgi:hypothetical protein
MTGGMAGLGSVVVEISHCSRYSEADDACAGEGDAGLWFGGYDEGRKDWQRLEKNAGQTGHKKSETDSSDIVVFLIRG